MSDSHPQGQENQVSSTPLSSGYELTPQPLAVTRLPRLASSPAMKSSIPKPLATGLNGNKRKIPSSPAGPPAKRVVSNPLAQSTAGPGPRRAGGFVPTTRKTSATLGSAVGGPSRPTSASSSLASSTATRGAAATRPGIGASRLGASTTTRAGVGARSTATAAPVGARRPPATTTTRSAVGAGRSAGPSRGVSPGMGGSNIGSGMASMVQIKVSWCFCVLRSKADE